MVFFFSLCMNKNLQKYTCRWRQGSEYATADFSASFFPYLLNWVNSTSAPPRSVVKPYSLKFVKYFEILDC